MNLNTGSDQTREDSDGNKNAGEKEEIKKERVDFAELLKMLGKIKKNSTLDEENQQKLLIITKNIEDLQRASEK